MVAHQGKRVNTCTRSLCQTTHSIQELCSIRVIPKDTALLNSPNHHMVQCTRRIKSRSSWHNQFIMMVIRIAYLMLMYEKIVIRDTKQRPEILRNPRFS